MINHSNKEWRMNMDVYKECPVLENDIYKIRLIEEKDSEDLLKVYSDKNSLPFFNSDNCNGSNFYCSTQEHMDALIKYWLMEYHKLKGFVRFSIIDKQIGEVIGTIEMFKRYSEDSYNKCGVLRLDVRSDYEQADLLHGIIELFIDQFYEWFECSVIITKAQLYAVERIKALEEMKFAKAGKPLIGHNQNMVYNDYWIRHMRYEDMNEQSIAYCGLICNLCNLEGTCNCKSDNNCGKRLSPEGCYQYNCCNTKGIKGCWECQDSPCGKDMLSEGHTKIRAFVKCMKEDGINNFIGYIKKTQQNGMVYHRNGYTGDYDLPTEEEILKLLRE